MALTGMQIYKHLPKTNCKDCGVPTCMAFAMQVAAKQRALTQCPHMSEEGKAALSEASAPPMKLVTIGAGSKEFKLGQETVMFRHEERFHRASGIALRIPASLSPEEALALVDQYNSKIYERVGATLKPALYAVELDGVQEAAGRVKSIAEKSNAALMLVSTDPAIMKTAAGAVREQRPLLHKATASNIAEMAAIAAEYKLPLVIAAENLETLADLTQQAKGKGVEEIILGFDTAAPGETVRNLTLARRAALKKNFRQLGFPALVEITAGTEEEEGILAAVSAAKYAGIVFIKGAEPWELLPLFTAIQDVYTDPQVPNTVEAKLYEFGSPGPDAPVLFTTNFSLTYFSVASEVERSKIPCYICVVDTEGLGVLNSYAGDKISPEKVIKTLEAQQVASKVSHRKLIIPGLLPIFRAEIEESSEWKEVIIGPENSKEIPAFLMRTWK